MMTRKDFEAIAEGVAFARRYTDQALAFEYLTAYLAQCLAETNPRFDRARFEAACRAVPKHIHPQDSGAQHDRER